MKNRCGQEAQVGDQIVYAVKGSCSASLTAGEVLVAEERRIRVRRLMKNRGRYLYGKPDSVSAAEFLAMKPVWIHSGEFMITSRGGVPTDFATLESEQIAESEAEYQK